MQALMEPMSMKYGGGDIAGSFNYFIPRTIDQRIANGRENYREKPWHNHKRYIIPKVRSD